MAEKVSAQNAESAGKGGEVMQEWSEEAGELPKFKITSAIVERRKERVDKMKTGNAYGEMSQLIDQLVEEQGVAVDVPAQYDVDELYDHITTCSRRNFDKKMSLKLKDIQKFIVHLKKEYGLGNDAAEVEAEVGAETPTTA